MFKRVEELENEMNKLDYMASELGFYIDEDFETMKNKQESFVKEVGNFLTKLEKINNLNMVEINRLNVKLEIECDYLFGELNTHYFELLQSIRMELYFAMTKLNAEQYAEEMDNKYNDYADEQDYFDNSCSWDE